MIRNFFMILLLFIMYEGFSTLPEKMVIPFPGVFRMADTILMILAFFSLIFYSTVLRVLHRFHEESMLIITACVLVLLSPLMALLFFDQPYLTGLLLLRHNLFYLTFIMFVLLLRPRDQLDNSLMILNILFCVYIVFLLFTKYFPSLGLIHYQEGYYESIGYMRFGEHRLYFPSENVPILLYCLALAGILHPRRKKGSLRKASAVLFIFLLIYAILETGTRAVFISLFLTTTFALFTSNQRMLRNMAIASTIIIICAQTLAVEVSGRGISFLEDSKLGKIVMLSDKLPPETERMFQVSMYMKHFIKSPLTGVGNLRSGKTHDEAQRTYRKYGFWNAVDIGYLKMAAENGMVGMVWVVWLYSYLYRRSKQTLKKALALGDEPIAEAVARGLRYFLIYLAISGFTLPHLVVPDRIPAIVLALAIMAVTRESLRLRTADSTSREVGANPALGSMERYGKAFSCGNHRQLQRL